MNEQTSLQALTGSDVLTMSTREIADLTGKEHRNVMRDTRAMLEGMGEGGALRFEHTHRNEQNGQSYPIFRLPYRECMILVSGYDLALRVRIIDRWMELEGIAIQEPAAKPIPKVSRRAALSAFKAYADFGRMIGLDTNQTILAANRATRKDLGVDFMAAMEITHIEAPQQATLLTPTDIGVRLGMSAIAVNKMLIAAGFQTECDGAKGRLIKEPTEKGKPYAVFQDTGKKHSDGTPVRQMKWTADVIAKLSIPPVSTPEASPETPDDEPSRRGLLMGVAAAAVSLLGLAAPVHEAKAMPVTDAPLERYVAYLAHEHRAALIELGLRSARTDAERERIKSGQVPTNWYPDDLAIVAMVKASQPSTRAAVILSAAGVPLS